MDDSKPFEVEAFLATVGSGHIVSSHDSGHVIFTQGDTADDLFLIRNGTVKISVVSMRGKEAVIGILAAGGFLGESVLTGQETRVSTATTLTKCRISCISKELMSTLLQQNPRFCKFFADYLLARNRRVEEDLVDQLFNSSEKRLARALLLLAKFGQDVEPDTVVPDITQETLAEIVGTTRSRVSFFMNKFRKLGYIEYNGRLKIHAALINVLLHD